MNGKNEAERDNKKSCKVGKLWMTKIPPNISMITLNMHKLICEFKIYILRLVFQTYKVSYILFTTLS